MSKRNTVPSSGRHESESSRQEQALCRAALDSTDFDGLSDQEWVWMCERIAREATNPGEAVVAPAPVAAEVQHDDED